MAKMSKYEMMVNQVVNEVLVTGYRRVEKVSKTTGKKYFKYEVELENVLWVSTQSFNKGSFKKRLAKLMANKETKQEQPKYELILWQPIVRDGFGRFSNDCLNIITKEFNECTTIQKARKVFRKYANYCHPDKGFNTYVDNKNWEFVLHRYEGIVALINVLKLAWDEDDFSWDAC
jgi:hypothetical protein